MSEPDEFRTLMEKIFGVENTKQFTVVDGLSELIRSVLVTPIREIIIIRRCAQVFGNASFYYYGFDYFGTDGQCIARCPSDRFETLDALLLHLKPNFSHFLSFNNNDQVTFDEKQQQSTKNE